MIIAERMWKETVVTWFETALLPRLLACRTVENYDIPTRLAGQRAESWTQGLPTTMQHGYSTVTLCDRNGCARWRRVLTRREQRTFRRSETFVSLPAVGDVVQSDTVLSAAVSDLRTPNVRRDADITKLFAETIGSFFRAQVSYLEDGYSMFLFHVGKFIPDCTASLSRINQYLYLEQD